MHAGEIRNAKLADALASKLEFTQEELDALGLSDLRADSFIWAQGKYFHTARSAGPGGEAGPYQALVLPHGWAVSRHDRAVRVPDEACTQHIGDLPPRTCCPQSGEDSEGGSEEVLTDDMDIMEYGEAEHWSAGMAHRRAQKPMVH